ncbi:hypothetical protein, partial [Enterobacter hormaechei]|uniref:hypothetical protein n=1 Tax=Enterobacter hormaechei TaxID=158836 RepID=UPI002874C0AC
ISVGHYSVKIIFIYERSRRTRAAFRDIQHRLINYGMPINYSLFKVKKVTKHAPNPISYGS